MNTPVLSPLRLLAAVSILLFKSIVDAGVHGSALERREQLPDDRLAPVALKHPQRSEQTNLGARVAEENQALTLVTRGGQGGYSGSGSVRHGGEYIDTREKRAGEYMISYANAHTCARARMYVSHHHLDDDDPGLHAPADVFKVSTVVENLRLDFDVKHWISRPNTSE